MYLKLLQFNYLSIKLMDINSRSSILHSLVNFSGPLFSPIQLVQRLCNDFHDSKCVNKSRVSDTHGIIDSDCSRKLLVCSQNHSIPGQASSSCSRLLCSTATGKKVVLRVGNITLSTVKRKLQSERNRNDSERNDSVVNHALIMCHGGIVVVTLPFFIVLILYKLSPR